MKALDYRHPGEEPSVREVVTKLHAEIAALSPEHAALVAAYEETRARPQPRPPYAHPQMAARDGRAARYAELRRGGASCEEAGKEVGVTAKTAGRYEQRMRLAADPAPQDRAAGEPPPVPRRVRLSPDPAPRPGPAGSPGRGQPPQGQDGVSGAEFRARVKAAQAEQNAARRRTAGRYVPVAARDPGGQYRPGMARRPPPETPDPRSPPESGPGAGEDASMRRGA